MISNQTEKIFLRITVYVSFSIKRRHAFCKVPKVMVLDTFFYPRQFSYSLEMQAIN